jgi:hypothetical protein
MGTGLLAQMSAEADKDKRRERAAKCAADHTMRQAEAVMDRQLADAESALTAITHATLVAAGFHKHKGQWRKKRHENQTNAG